MLRSSPTGVVCDGCPGHPPMNEREAFAHLQLAHPRHASMARTVVERSSVTAIPTELADALCELETVAPDLLALETQLARGMPPGPALKLIAELVPPDAEELLADPALPPSARVLLALVRRCRAAATAARN